MGVMGGCQTPFSFTNDVNLPFTLYFGFYPNLNFSLIFFSNNQNVIIDYIF